MNHNFPHWASPLAQWLWQERTYVAGKGFAIQHQSPGQRQKRRRKLQRQNNGKKGN